ncbi:SH3 domain-containing protein [Sporolactobacillus pectinivorans]|uniref:SH3 domain-containing protein n=1 Tax=Sporolactobacillus pectinivorans TaxID=1591408 RepID=UPI000C2694DE|nr:SH3 domain-containing protein [Sporolactobacillus pectinivorans]
MTKCLKSVAAVLLFCSLFAGSLTERGQIIQAAAAYRAYITAKTTSVYIGPGTRYRSAGTLHENNGITVLGTTGGWTKISYKGSIRYVWGKYVRKGTPPNPFKSYSAYVIPVSLQIRNAASTHYRMVRTSYRGAKVTVIGKSGNYSKVEYGSQSGYVLTTDLSNFSPFSAYVTASSLCLRAGASTRNRIIKYLHDNDRLTVYAQYGSWYYIKYGNIVGYASEQYIKKGTPPKPKFIAYSAYVTTYTLPVRSQPSTHYKTVAILSITNRVTVTGITGSYSKVSFGSKSGYVETKYLSRSMFRSFNVYVNVSTLNMNKGPGNDYGRPVRSLNRNNELTVYGQIGNWYYVKCGSSWGYVAAQSTKTGYPPKIVSAPKPKPVPSPKPVPKPIPPVQPKPVSTSQSQPVVPAPFKTYTAYIGYDFLNVYQNPTSNSIVVATLRERTPVTVIGKDQSGNWLKINDNGTQGFVNKANLDTDLSHFAPPAALKYGVDISHYQGNVDFNALYNAGNRFVILKASEGAPSEGSNSYFYDSKFATYVQQVKEEAPRLQLNAYQFFRARNTKDAAAEADYYISILKQAGINNSNSIGYTFLDVEAKSGSTTLFSGISPKQMSLNINAFMDEMKSKGFTKLGLYSGKSFYETNIVGSGSQLESGLLLWLARYRGEDTSQGIGSNYNVDLWQYTSNGSVNGINGSVDLDVDYSNKF